VPTLRKAVLLERGGFSRDVPAWSLRPGSAEDSARQAASFAFWRIAIGELAVYHAVAEERNVGGSRKAPSVSTLSPIQDKSLRVGGLVDEGWGLQPEREQGPLRTLEGLQQHDCRYRTKTGAASRRSCLASLSSCEGVATLALAAEQCGKLICSRILICSMQGVHRKAPYGIG
jgi:hypothetical protein